LFFIFGVKSLSEKTLKQHQEESKKYASFENFDYTKNVIENTQRSIFMYGYMTSLRPIYKNNDISIIEKDADLYYEMIKLIRSAKKNIHIQMYLMHDGFFLRTFFAELILKAKEGVKIRFLYD
jgi:cardiolipin synthase